LSGDLGAILGRRADVLGGLLGMHFMRVGTGLLQKGADWLGGKKK